MLHVKLIYGDPRTKRAIFANLFFFYPNVKKDLYFECKDARKFTRRDIRSEN